MDVNLDKLAVAVEAAIDCHQDAASLLRGALGLLEGHQEGAVTMDNPALYQTLAVLIQKALGEAECAQDLVQIYGEDLAKAACETPPPASRFSPVKAVA